MSDFLTEKGVIPEEGILKVVSDILYFIYKIKKAILLTILLFIISFCNIKLLTYTFTPKSPEAEAGCFLLWMLFIIIDIGTLIYIIGRTYDYVLDNFH